MLLSLLHLRLVGDRPLLDLAFLSARLTMKSEKRHQLEKNELADWMGGQIEAAKPHILTILAGIVLVVGVLIFAIYYFNTDDTASASQWSEYFQAFSEREPMPALEELTKEDPDSGPALWAAQTLGDINLARGSMELFSDRVEAKKMLAVAEENYKKVEAKADHPPLVTRARIGLAKVYEAQGNIADARKYYEMVAKAEKDTALGLVATRGLERMTDPRDVDAVKWFLAQQPKRPAPLSGMPGAMPGMPDLPERPDLSFPDNTNLDAPGTVAPGASPALEFPPSASPPPAGEPKADEPKGSEPKADDKKIDEPKANEKKAEEPKSDEKAADAPDSEKAPE